MPGDVDQVLVQSAAILQVTDTTPALSPPWTRWAPETLSWPDLLAELKAGKAPSERLALGVQTGAYVCLLELILLSQGE